jgi:uncharacterized protein YdeI (YjbR/CyaY-like superfamily)
MDDDTAIARFESASHLEAWLEENQDSSDGVWLLIAKKGAPFATVTYAEAVELGLRYGWIDGQAKSVDEHSYTQRYTPRRARSMWSARNVRAAEELIATGRMTPRGLAEVERARADGRWAVAYDGPRDAQPHPDFLAALAANPTAAAFYETLGSQNRFAIYFQIQGAKRDETRARRIAKYVSMLERGEKVYG